MHHPQAKPDIREKYLKDLDQLKYKYPIVYLDESGFKSHEHRSYGYSKQGTPCYGSYNWQLKNQTNAIGAIIKVGYLQSVYLIVRLILMYFIFGWKNFLSQSYPKTVLL